MDRHDLPNSVFLLILLGSVCSIAGLFLFFAWKDRQKRKRPLQNVKTVQPPSRRKAKGRKPYR